MHTTQHQTTSTTDQAGDYFVTLYIRPHDVPLVAVTDQDGTVVERRQFPQGRMAAQSWASEQAGAYRRLTAQRMAAEIEAARSVAAESDDQETLEAPSAPLTQVLALALAYGGRSTSEALEPGDTLEWDTWSGTARATVASVRTGAGTASLILESASGHRELYERVPSGARVVGRSERLAADLEVTL